jgi:uncharacterized protein (DUF849 family)
MAAAQGKVIITCAITGAIHTEVVPSIWTDFP